MRRALNDSQRADASGLCCLAGGSLDPGAAHLAARPRAAAAHTGAILAVLRLVLAAFIGTCFTDLRAHKANRASQRARSRHETAGQTTDGGAVDIERDAVRHHLDVIFLQTGAGAAIAGLRAGITAVDTCLKLIDVQHFSVPTG
jgi:hypothetical protein